MTKKPLLPSCHFSFIKIACLLILLEIASITANKENSPTNSTSAEVNNGTQIQYEFGMDSIIISEDSEPEISVILANNSTNVSLTEDEMSTRNPTTVLATTENDYDGTESYTEPTWETTSVDSGKEIYDAKERLNLLEARMKLLEDVNIVWWNNFREMGAPLPKKVT